MNFKTKIAIFAAALLLTLFGFSLIASPTLEMMKIGKQAGYEKIANFLSRTAAAANLKG